MSHPILKRVNRTSQIYAWYVVGILALFYVLSFVDRLILALLAVPLKADLGLTDIQLSYLGGISFVLFYTLFGLPMGRLADTRSRRGLIAFGVVLWSAMTTLCSFATRFWHLLILRMGVGIGEATLSPSAFSLIADYFPRERLATAISVYSTGAAIGLGASYLGGALILDWANAFVAANEGFSLPLLGEVRPWQLVMLSVGLPGLIFSLLLVTVKEPERRKVANLLQSNQSLETGEIPLSEVVRYFRNNWRLFAFHNLGMACIALGAFGSGFWDITFLSRSY